MLSRPFLSRVPDQALVVAGQGDGVSRVQVTRDATPGRSDASYLMAYFPEHREVTLATEAIAGAGLRGWWFSPRTGDATALGTLRKEPKLAFAPPTNVPGEDWVLVLDDAARRYPAPGETPFTLP
jgi:hypothetical protein